MRASKIATTINLSLTLTLSLTAIQCLLPPAEARVANIKPPGPYALAGQVDINPYMKKVGDKLGPLWNPPSSAKVPMVTVVFTIGKTGVPSAISVKEPSGDDALDALAIATVKKAGNFGPLPAGVPEVRANFGLPCKSGSTTSGASAQSYMDAMGAKIKTTWWVPQRLLYNQVVLQIGLNADGSISQSSVSKTSGDAAADKLALLAVRRAAPYGNLPEGVSAPFKISYTLGYKRDNRDSFAVWNGQKVGMNESYQTSGGHKTTFRDTTTAADKAQHQRKEAALLKMFDLDEAITKAPEALSSVPLMRQYAAQCKIIDEHRACEDMLNKALALAKSIDGKDSTADSKREVGASLLALGEYLYSTGNLAGAEPVLKEGIALKESGSPKEGDKVIADADYKEMLGIYAKLLYKLNRSAEADDVYRKIKAAN